MSDTRTQPQLVKAREMAAALDASTDELTRLVREGRIGCYRLAERPQSWRYDPDEVMRALRVDAKPGLSMATPIDVAAIKWLPLNPTRVDHADCDAFVALQLADELIGFDAERSVCMWARIDYERTAFRMASADSSAVWIVTIDADGAPDGHSKATRVEIIRV